MPKQDGIDRVESTIALQRNLLSSIDLSDVKEEELDESERQAYNAAIFAVFPRLKKDIEKFMYEQLLFGANQADTWERVTFSRGTFNGFALLLEHWQNAAKSHEADAKPEEKFDKHEVISKVDE